MYAEVIVDISLEKLDRVFEYRIPDELCDSIRVGVQVDIPFGNSNRTIKGYVVGIVHTPVFNEYKIKSITGVTKESVAIESTLIELAEYIHSYFGGSMNQALKTVLPVHKTMRQEVNRLIELAVSEEQAQEYLMKYQKSNSKAKYRLLQELIDKKNLSGVYIKNDLKISKSTLDSVMKDGLISIESETLYRNPLKNVDEQEYDIILNGEQQKVYNDISEYMDKKVPSTHLIYGITGSGKTEVYISLMERIIKEGKQAIILIPEIALTYQTVMRFHRKFGNRISIMNSKLSAGERYDQYERASKGEIDIMVGPRSALFTPFARLGLIIIDEEHESSYKSESVPRYNAREVAQKRIEMCNGTLVLGSATPSVDSYYMAENGKIVLHTLKNRAKNSSLAEVAIVDMRKELEEGNKTMFSKSLDMLIRDRLTKHEQIMLFINRRGYAGFVSCRKCGKVIKCPHCDVSLTLHRDNTLRCHYCGYMTQKMSICPSCGSKYIGIFGTGTEKVEEAVHKMYPTARVMRMDSDTTRKKGGHEEILAAFANEEADILIGTQMIVKGHDFPMVTLVGVIAADMSLHAANYHASERTFQLLTQAAGRAGRDKRAGNVVIQTYDPDNFCIEAAANQNFEEFYDKEILYRKLSGYPPVVAMMAVIVSSKEEKDASVVADLIKEYVDGMKVDRIIIIGPANAGIAKINDVYSRVIYVKHSNYDKLVSIKDNIDKYIKNNVENRYKNVSVQMDFNPLSC